MPGFDPDKYLAQNSAPAKKDADGGFDPDRYLANERPRPRLSPVESAISGAAQGLTFGFSDEIIGAARAGVGKLKGEGSFTDLYPKYRDEQRQHIGHAKSDNPISFGVGTVGSLVVPGVAAAKGASVFSLLPRAASSTAANVAKAGAAGALTGAGYSNANPTESPAKLKEFGKDVAVGGAVGAALQGAFSAVAGIGNALRPSSLRKLAEEKAVKAAGAMTREQRELARAGTLRPLGRELLDKKIVTFGASLEDVAERAGAQKAAAGQEIGNALQKVDDLVAAAKGAADDGTIALPEQAKAAFKAQLDDAYQFNMQRIGQRIEKEIIAPNAKNPLLRGEMQKLAAIADDFKSQAPQTLAEGNVIKGTQGKITNFNSDTVPQAFKQEVYGIIKTELEDVVEKTAQLQAAVAKNTGLQVPKLAEGAKDAKAAYVAAKKSYGLSKEAEEIAERRLGTVRSNRELSLTDYIAGGAGLASGGPAQALLLGGANKLLRRYGDAALAVGADKLALVIEKSPEALGKFGPLLIKAARDNTSLMATHTALMKDPEYAAIIKNTPTNAIQRRLQGGR